MNADPLLVAVTTALRAEFDRIAAEEAEAAVIRMRERIGQSLDAIALKILRHYEVSRDQDHVVIRVDKRDVDERPRP